MAKNGRNHHLRETNKPGEVMLRATKAESATTLAGPYENVNDAHTT